MAGRNLILACILLGAILTVPSASTSASEQVLWPDDLDEPLDFRAASVADALNVTFDYALFGYLPAPDIGEWDETNQVLRVELETVNGTVVLELPALRDTENADGHVSNRLEPADLPTGMNIHASFLHIEAAPGAFDRFGRGVAGVQAVAAALGLPDDVIPWENATKRSGTYSPLAPGIDSLTCDCTEWEIPGPIRSANLLRYTLTEDGDLVAFHTTAWLGGELEPRFKQEQAEAALTLRLQEEGFTAIDEAFEARLYWETDHGLHWYLPFHVREDPDGVAFGVFRFDAHTGEVLEEDWAVRTPPGSVEQTWAPALWQIGAAVAVALLWLRRATSTRSG